MKFFGLAIGTVALIVAPASAREATSVTASVYWPGDGIVKRHDYNTSSGERYDAKAMTCAHKTLPLGTRLIVRYGDNYAEVKVNDRGPFYQGPRTRSDAGSRQEFALPRLGPRADGAFPAAARTATGGLALKISTDSCGSKWLAGSTKTTP